MLKVIVQDNQDNIDYLRGNVIFFYITSNIDFSMELFLVKYLVKYAGVALNCDSIKANMLESLPQEGSVWDASS